MTKRIALVLPNMGGGGAERVALTLMRGFLERGHEVDLVLMRAEGELMEVVPSGVRVFDLKAKRIRSALRPLVRYLRQRRPDAVQARMWPMTVMAIFARILARSKARLAVSDHAILSKHYAGSAPATAALKLTTRLYALADARICVSEGSAIDLSRVSGLGRERFTVIHNPTEPPARLPGPIPAVEQSWAGAGRRILTVGSLAAAKNQALLIRALARLGDARLMILGDGPLRADLEKLARELGVSDRVILPGFVNDPWPYYASADLFVLSSDQEAFGNVLVEAMAAGLPIVSTDCEGGPREILDGGRYGALIPVGDVDAMAAAIRHALAAEPDREALQRRARHYRPGPAVERYLDLLLGCG